MGRYWHEAKFCNHDNRAHRCRVVTEKQTKVFGDVNFGIITTLAFQWCFNTSLKFDLLGVTFRLNVLTEENVTQIKYVLQYCVTCLLTSTNPGSLNPGTRRSRVPGWWDPGIRMNTGTGNTVLANTYLICIIAHVLEIVFIPPLCSKGGRS